MRKEEDRKAFEEWFFGDDFKPEHRSGESYHLMSAYSQWSAWQAAIVYFRTNASGDYGHGPEDCVKHPVEKSAPLTPMQSEHERLRNENTHLTNRLKSTRLGLMEIHPLLDDGGNSSVVGYQICMIEDLLKKLGKEPLDVKS